MNANGRVLKLERYLVQKKDDLRFLKIPFPPLPEQQKIASILGALDDKIQMPPKQQ